jgi:hypothetical protein
MSTWIDTTATCPSCQATTPARVAASVHITRVPEVRTSVLDRTINRFTCSGCAQRIEIDHAFTYVDVERGHWVHVEPTRRRSEWGAVEEHTMQALTRGLDFTSPIVSELAVSAQRRLVFGSEELREKLIVWDAGIDDGLLECIKLRMSIDEPSLARARMIADCVSDDGGLELVRVDADPRSRFAVPAAWVDRALDDHASLRARFPELFRGGFVNALRLVALMLVLGCSQPTPRESPRVQKKDAAVAADAASEEPMTDSAETATSTDAAHKVAWDSLRSRETSSSSIRVAAIAVRVDNGADGPVAVFDRGEEHGVRKGWKGRLIDRDGHRVLEAFEVVKVEKRRCFGRGAANPDQLAGNNRAVLWDPAAGGEP